jgi:hypothetical protein
MLPSLVKISVGVNRGQIVNNAISIFSYMRFHCRKEQPLVWELLTDFLPFHLIDPPNSAVSHSQLCASLVEGRCLPRSDQWLEENWSAATPSMVSTDNVAGIDNGDRHLGPLPPVVHAVVRRHDRPATKDLS